MRPLRCARRTLQVAVPAVVLCDAPATARLTLLGMPAAHVRHPASRSAAVLLTLL
ncbi:hypothetical protein ACWDZ4_01645 [Streptomyces sp. NPDC003016]